MTRDLAREEGRGAFLRIGAEEARGGGAKRRGGPAEPRPARPRRSPPFETLGEEARPTPPKRGRPRRLLAFLGFGLALLGLGLGLAYLASSLLLRRIEVGGLGSLKAAEVVAASGLKPGSRLLGLDLGGAARRLEAWAPVARARVSLLLPDGVRLDIVERRPVAYALVEEGSSTLPVALDAEGVAYGKLGPGSLQDLPILSGIRFEGWSPGVRLPDYLSPTLASLGALVDSDPALLSLFSEIRVERSAWGEVELLLFPLHHAIPVRTGPRLDAPLLRSIVLVLDALDKGGLSPGAGELDFRSGTVVFRSKEGRSG